MNYKVPILNHLHAAEAIIRATDSQFCRMDNEEIKRRLALALEETKEVQLIINKVIEELNENQDEV